MWTETEHTRARAILAAVSAHPEVDVSGLWLARQVKLTRLQMQDVNPLAVALAQHDYPGWTLTVADGVYRWTEQQQRIIDEVQRRVRPTDTKARRLIATAMALPDDGTLRNTVIRTQAEQLRVSFDSLALVLDAIAAEESVS